MPTKRILLTLGEVKQLVAKKYKVNIESVDIFKEGRLAIADTKETFPVWDEGFLFQFEVK